MPDYMQTTREISVRHVSKINLFCPLMDSYPCKVIGSFRK